MASYKIIGRRALRKYTAPHDSPVYAASIDAAEIVKSLCTVPWQTVAVKDARITSHTDDADESGVSGLDQNVASRDEFDAALFCSDHHAGMHRAHANAAVYRYRMPDAAVGKTLSSLRLDVISDAYNAAGARIHLITNATGEIPTNCRECRGESASGEIIDDGSTAAGVAPRTVQTVSGKDYWYPTSSSCTIAPAGGMVLERYLLVFVLLESYSTVRANWLEGSSYIRNLAEITTSAAVDGWTEGETYDLSIGGDHEYNVVSGGVYPELVGDVSGVQTIQLQRTGDPIVPTAVSEDTSCPSGLHALTAGRVSRILDVPADSITCILPVGAAKENIWSTIDDGVTNTHTTRSQTALLVVGGTFDGGSIPGINGLYFINQATNSPITDCMFSTGVAIPDFLKDFAKNHGGLAYAPCFYAAVGADSSLSLICKDGTFLGVETTIAFPIKFHVVRDASRGSLALAVTAVDGMAFAHYGFGGADDKKLEVFCSPSNYAYPENGATANLYISFLGWNKSDNTVQQFFTSAAVGWKIALVVNPRVLQVVGEITNIAPQGDTQNDSTATPMGAFIISGRLTSVGGTACRNFACINHNAVIVPSIDAQITPDDYSGYAVWGLFRDVFKTTMSNGKPTYSGRWTGGGWFVTGRYRSLGGDSSFARLTVVTAAGTKTAVLHPEDTPPAGILYRNIDGLRSYLYAAGASTAETHVVYHGLHPDITDAQSAIGLRTAYAALYRGALAHCDAAMVSPDRARVGAQFVLRSDAITLTDANGDDVSVPTWQLSTAKLVVAFAAPVDFAATAVRLDWGPMAVTPGARLNVWLKDSYENTCPEITDVAIYDCSKPEVNGWRLVGTINAAALSATLPIDLHARVATLMFTAWISLDDVNPAANMTMPAGVGEININTPHATVTGADTGWRPDITLIG